MGGIIFYPLLEGGRKFLYRIYFKVTKKGKGPKSPVLGKGYWEFPYFSQLRGLVGNFPGFSPVGVIGGKFQIFPNLALIKGEKFYFSPENFIGGSSPLTFGPFFSPKAVGFLKGEKRRGEELGGQGAKGVVWLAGRVFGAGLRNFKEFGGNFRELV